LLIIYCNIAFIDRYVDLEKGYYEHYNYG
jgi:hypothetical protein